MIKKIIKGPKINFIDRKKQEIKSVLCNNNWYRLAIKKYPYKIVEILKGMESPIEGLENSIVDATSPSQARFLFMKFNPWLKNYLLDKKGVFGDTFDIEAKFDLQTLKNRENREKEKERQIQDAWWNK